MPIEYITLLISVCSVGIAFAVFMRNSRHDSGKQDQHNAEVVTKLDFIGEDVKDVKADQRAFQSQINDVRTIAINAYDKAESAHNRLDRAGIDKH